MVPLYILGLIVRFGPQHGYQIRKMIAEQLADFAQIKLPTIYYHLSRMEADGLVTARREKADARPEKTVYALTARGERAFSGMLAEALKFEYRPSFSADAAFFFSDRLDPEALREALFTHAQALRTAIPMIEAHRAESVALLPPEHARPADVIFCHHLKHYRAELEWAEEALGALNEQEE
jgi:DNA-binding PadR family transcriptional regulator